MDRKVLKVAIKATPTVHKYPDFQTLPSVKASGMTRQKYIDRECGGWLLDKKNPMYVDSAESPFGTWYGILLAPVAFANEAVAKFPDVCSIITNAEAKTFYENNFSHNQPSELIDVGVLTAIKLKQDLGLALTADQISAIDPATNTVGVRKNNKKLWEDVKAKFNVTIVG